jgi:hypothetical protein
MSLAVGGSAKAAATKSTAGTLGAVLSMPSDIFIVLHYAVPIGPGALIVY